MISMRIGRILRWLGAAGGLLLIIVALPVLGIETACRAPGPETEPITGHFGVSDPGYHMPVSSSVLSYPEWYIVYAYQDFAAILQHGDESAFPYLASISDYWRGFCVVNRIASAQGEVDPSEKVMLYVIGLSFTAELGAKGAYETTIGRVSAWLRGTEKTTEDRLAVSVAEDYASFLQQRAWYEFPFWEQVRRLHRDTPFGHSSFRALERRFALTSEWTVKTAYAWIIGGGAELDPAALQIESVVRGLDESDRGPGSNITLRRELGDGLALVVTPRYAAFTHILLELAAHGRQIVEIAGNDTILLTALAPQGVDLELPNTRAIFAYPVRSRPGWHRDGMLVGVPSLIQTIQELQSRGAVLEHVYDY